MTTREINPNLLSSPFPPALARLVSAFDLILVSLPLCSFSTLVGRRRTLFPSVLVIFRSYIPACLYRPDYTSFTQLSCPYSRVQPPIPSLRPLPHYRSVPAHYPLFLSPLLHTYSGIYNKPHGFGYCRSTGLITRCARWLFYPTKV